MKTLEIDVSKCTTREDIFESLLAALGSPDWHGRNLDALCDSITGGCINQVEPPFKLVFGGSKELRGELRVEFQRVIDLLKEARRECDIEVVVK